MKILLIEDEKQIYQLINWFVIEASKEDPRLSGAELAYADNLADGLESLKAGGVDVVLLDLNLPDSQGFDTFEAIRNNAGDTPIVVLTGLADSELLSRIIAGGTKSYLIKGDLNLPVIINTVLSAIG